MPTTENNNQRLAGAFPVISFATLPSGMERSKGRLGRTEYDWGALLPKDGIKVDGMRYNSAQGSAMNFANNHPMDEEQQKKYENHMRGRITAARNAFKKEVESKGDTFTDDLWTDELIKAVKPDPDFMQGNVRMFASQAVRGEGGKVIKTKGYKTGGKNPTDLADEYYIIRTQ